MMKNVLFRVTLMELRRTYVGLQGLQMHQEALNFTMETVQLIKYSSKWQVIFENIQKVQGNETVRYSLSNTMDSKNCMGQYKLF